MNFYLKKRSSKAKAAIMLFAVFVIIDIAAIIVQQRKMRFGLPVSHNTIFHIIEIPALMMLFLSMRKTDAPKINKLK